MTYRFTLILAIREWTEIKAINLSLFVWAVRYAVYLHGNESNAFIWSNIPLLE